MSGTSIDAIDAVILEISDNRRPALIATRSEDFPPQLQPKLVRLCQAGGDEIALAGRCHTHLGELYAGVANRLIAANNIKNIAVIGCHGQTVRHRPDGAHPFTLQLGNGAVIAHLTGVATVTDFRSADIARGGQGAPLAPGFHQAMFADTTKSRAIVNLGGIANVTILPAAGNQPVVGFDTGPANGLMDVWIKRNKRKQFDENGDWAKSGNCNPLLLSQMLQAPYFARLAPKSTGRELFNQDWLDQQLQQFNRPVAPNDVQQTLAHLTAESIVSQIPATVDEIYLCGGGSSNTHLVQLIADASKQAIHCIDKLGFASRWIEASAFAWMANLTLNRIPCTLPTVTGAKTSAITGAIYLP